MLSITTPWGPGATSCTGGALAGGCAAAVPMPCAINAIAELNSSSLFRIRLPLSLMKIEVIENGRPHLWHHATVVAVCLEILEIKTLFAHEGRHRAAALE